MAVKIDVQLHGFFFTGNPIGRLHVNTYGVLRDEGDFAQEVAKRELSARQRTFGRGTQPEVVLGDNIVKVPMRRRRTLMKVVVSASYGPQPWARRYNRFIEDASLNRPRGVFRGYHMYRSAARATQAHIDGQIGHIADRLIQGIT